MKERTQSTGPSLTTELMFIVIVRALIVALGFQPVSVFALNQGQVTTVGVFGVRDEASTGPAAAEFSEIARQLVRKMNTDNKDVLARQLDIATDSSSMKAATMEQLGQFGKQRGVKFVVRCGSLEGDGKSSNETGIAIQLYADIVFVETLTIRSIRVEGSGAQKEQAFSNAIAQLAASIHQAIISPDTQSAAPEDPQQFDSATAPKDEVVAAEGDEELQQLVAQAESLVSDGAIGSEEHLASVSQALDALKSALKKKSTLLEQAKDPAPADREIAIQKERLGASLSVLDQGGTPGAPVVVQESSPSGEKKSLLSRISEYAGETLNIIQKIQEMRAAFRGSDDSNKQIETSAADPAGSTLPSSESTEEITGVVTEMGEPVAGVTVTEPESGAKTVTDSSGSYALAGVPSGRLARLVLDKSGKQVATGRIDLARGRAAIADFELSKSKGSSQSALRIVPSTVMVARAKAGGGAVGILKGVVRDAQGRPAARALVQLKGLALARADSQGRYTFLNVRPGTHQLIVQKSGLRPRTETVKVETRNNESKIQFSSADTIPTIRNRQPLVVRGAGTILRGAVTDLQKRPLAGAKITVLQQTSVVSVISAVNGVYLLRDIRPGSYRVLVSRAGYDSIAQTIAVRAGEPQPRDFQLRKTDSPVLEKALAARFHSPPRPRSSVGTSNRTGSEDQPVNKGLEAVDRSPNKDRSEGTKGRVLDMKPDSGNDRRDATSHRNTPAANAKNGQLRGRVVNAKTGRPVAGALVSTAGRPAVITAGDGSYTLSDLTPGTYRVIVRKSLFIDLTETLVVRAGEPTTTNLRLSLRPSSRVR